MNDTLHVVTTIANPIRWKSRVAIARAAIVDRLRERNVHVTIVEVAHGAPSYDLADLGEHMRVTHVPVRDDSRMVEGKLPEHRAFRVPT